MECGSKFDLQYEDVIPVALGGATVDNLQLPCGECNRMKGAARCLDAQDDGPVGQNEKRLPDALTNDMSTTARAAPPSAITHPRTVLNLVHSARSR